MEIYKLHHHDSTQLVKAISNSAWRELWCNWKTKIFGTKLKIERGYVQVLIASEKFIFSESGLVFLNLPVQFPIRAHVFESKSNNKRQQKNPVPSPPRNKSHCTITLQNVQMSGLLNFDWLSEKYGTNHRRKVTYRVCIECFMHVFAW